MHTEHDSIAQYTRALENAQQKAARAVMPITDTTLIMIATKEMTASQRLPTIDEKWEDLDKSLQTWDKWKGIWKKSDKQAMVKRQAAGGRNQFGGAVLGVGAGGSADPGRGWTPVTMDELEGCFDSLATDANTEKATWDELVKANSSLTLSIVELTATKTRLNKKVQSLSQEVNKYKKGGGKTIMARG